MTVRLTTLGTVHTLRAVAARPARGRVGAVLAPAPSWTAAAGEAMYVLNVRSGEGIQYVHTCITLRAVVMRPAKGRGLCWCPCQAGRRQRAAFAEESADHRPPYNRPQSCEQAWVTPPLAGAERLASRLAAVQRAPPVFVDGPASCQAAHRHGGCARGRLSPFDRCQCARARREATNRRGEPAAREEKTATLSAAPQRRTCAGESAPARSRGGAPSHKVVELARRQARRTWRVATVAFREALGALSSYLLPLYCLRSPPLPSGPVPITRLHDTRRARLHP